MEKKLETTRLQQLPSQLHVTAHHRIHAGGGMVSSLLPRGPCASSPDTPQTPRSYRVLAAALALTHTHWPPLPPIPAAAGATSERETHQGPARVC